MGMGHWKVHMGHRSWHKGGLWGNRRTHWGIGEGIEGYSGGLGGGLGKHRKVQEETWGIKGIGVA